MSTSLVLTLLSSVKIFVAFSQYLNYRKHTSYVGWLLQTGSFDFHKENMVKVFLSDFSILI